jgi:glycosyltransferase involved in cell wall biosynthesis
LKRVLVITYYWPPSGGAGVQRWLKFTKYLPSCTWQPVVYTPSNPEAPVDDPSLEQDIPPEALILKRPIREPYMLYKKFVGMGAGERINAGFLSEDEKPPAKEGLAVWVRGNLFIPDARKYWIRPSVRFLRRYLRDHRVDAMISTGPPHSMHLIALKLHRQLKIPWIADFRDPWTEIDYYDQLKLTQRADRKHRRLEHEVLTGADRVVVVGKTMARRFQEKTGIDAVVIPNGFDEADFTGRNGPSPEGGLADPGNPFTIVHVGAMNRDRNHPAFWQALAEVRKKNPDFARDLKIRLVGKLDHSVLRSIEEFQLRDCVEITSSLPHNQVIPLLQSASILYLPINNTPNARSIATGKLFEYLSAGRPILGVGPTDGDAADIINECRGGQMIAFTDRERIKKTLEEWIRRFREGKLSVEPISIDQYSRKTLTEKYAGLLDQLNPLSS